MEFTYNGYVRLLRTLREKGYQLSTFRDVKDSQPFTAILRHDVDISPSKAVIMAEKEAEAEVQSTYFIMVSSDFYNPMSRENESAIKRIVGLKHEVGLHFDARKYDAPDEDELCKLIRYEADILSSITGELIRSLSWHIPYKYYYGKPMERLTEFRNAYDAKYVEAFKYCSDSMMNWRDDPYDYLDRDEHPRLQILTHPEWYSENGSGTAFRILEDTYIEKREEMLAYLETIKSGVKAYING